MTDNTQNIVMSLIIVALLVSGLLDTRICGAVAASFLIVLTLYGVSQTLGTQRT